MVPWASFLESLMAILLRPALLVLSLACLLATPLGGGLLLAGDASGGRVEWGKLPAADGSEYSSDDFRHARAMVVVVTCNHCPIAIDYMARINEFVKQQVQPGGPVALVAISVSDLESDQLDRMKEFAKRHELTFPYIHDATQRVGRLLDAKYTPQVFVLDGDRKVVYRGAWDDQLNPQKVTKRYVEDAVAAVTQGKTPAVQETKGRGCIISYQGE